LKLRQCGGVVERRGISCQQKVDALVEEVAWIAGSHDKPNRRWPTRAGHENRTTV
jgi:hypothetical protein